MEVYERLTDRFEEIDRLGQVVKILMWDRAAMMPEGGAEARSEQMATLKRMRHELLTAPEVGEWLEEVDESDELSPWERANLREMRRVRRHAACVPEELVRRQSKTTSACERVWREARPADDFSRLRPYLEEVVEVTRQVAEVKSEAFGVEPYDALLDRFEPGMTSDRIDEIFDDLGAFLPGFVERVIDHQSRRPDPKIPEGPFEESRQKKLSRRLMQQWGFDFDHGRLDTSNHPFCGGYPEDVRLTTNYDEDNFLRATMAVLHETGHALYNRGLPPDWRGQPVGRARGMAVHESQSLFVEMQVSRSRSFLQWAAPLYREVFDRGGDGWSVDNLYRVVTQVERSLIRVDADEVTYPAHVILRYRLEKAMIQGELQVADLPGAWREGMEQLVGIAPEGDRDGCMQDIHWMDGMFGYFPTYTLGAMIAAQLFEAARRELGDIDEIIEEGRFRVLVDWLRDNVHSLGCRYETDELLEEATGTGLEASCFKDHLRRRYLGDVA